MNILIMADMEGVAGITVWDQVSYGAPLYEECRKLYTEELNACCRGLFAAGATRIVAVDCHGAGGDASFNSWVPAMVHEHVEIVQHHPWGRYTELLESGCDAAVMLAMHCKAGTPDGGMCHTISTTTWDDLKFNGVSVGEFGINTAICGVYDVPVIYVTGDDAMMREATDLVGPDLHCVSVKRSLSRYSARTLSPIKARKLIEAGAQAALENFKAGGKHPKPYKPGDPSEITVELSTVDTAARFKGRHGVEIVEPLRVKSRAATWAQAWDQIWDW